MMQFVITPHVGTAGIKFGMTRAEVANAVGGPERVYPDKEFFYGHALHVHYNDLERVELIEIARDAGAEALFRGTNLFAVRAEDAIRALGGLDAVDSMDPDYPATCVFPSIDVALWRPCLPADNPEDGSHFASVAFASEGYFFRHRQAGA